jgi:branched-chain amino acid transport system substrate-binding protein
MTSDYFSFATIGELDAQGGTSKLGLAYCAEATVCNLSSNLTKSIKVLGSSAQLVKSVSIAATQPNFTAACLTLKQAGVDNLNVSDQGDIIQKMVSDCAQQGYRPKNTDVFTGYTSKWLTDPNMDGTVIVSPNAYWGDSSVPGAVQYMAALKKYAPSAASSPNLYLAEFQTWLGGQLFAAAAKAGKIGPDSTPQDVKNALLSLKGETLGGAAPPLTFSKSSPTRVPCWFAYKVGGGALQALNGSKPICAT